MKSNYRKSEDSIDIIDEDQESYGKEGITPRQIVLSHLKHICDFIFKGEMKGDYTIDKGGHVSKGKDGREIIINAIKIFSKILAPHYDPDMNEVQDKFDEMIKDREEALMNAFINSRYNISEKKKLNHKKILRPVDKNSPEYEAELSWKFDLYLELFEEHNQLLARINYMAGEVYTE